MSGVDLLAAVERGGHEQVLVSHDPACGYLGIVAIHDTTLGPALGGTRLWRYPSGDEALRDALRLARGMTYKAAVAGINLGGGKAVVLGDPRRGDREALFRAHGRFIHTLGGRYITAEDVGTTPADMEHVRLETPYVGGLIGRSGDPSPVTAWGVYAGMKAAATACWGGDGLAGRTVALQGCGSVARHLARHLREEGAALVVTDLDPGKAARVAAETGARVVAPEAIYDEPADVFSPNALGGILDDRTIPRLRARIVAGGANNQLAEDRHGDLLAERGVLYAPDYVINAGGVINIYGELNGWPPDRARAKAGEIYDTLLRLFATAARDGIPTYRAADRLAEERLAAVRALRPVRPGGGTAGGR